MKCDALVSLADLSRRAREILGALMPMVSRAGVMAHTEEDDRGSSLLLRSLASVSRLLSEHQDTVRTVPQKPPSSPELASFSRSLALDAVSVSDCWTCQTPSRLPLLASMAKAGVKQPPRPPPRSQEGPREGW